MIRITHKFHFLAGVSLLCVAVGCGGSSKKKGGEPNGGTKLPSPAPNDESAALDAKYEKAVGHENEGNFREAYTLYMEIQGVDPDYKNLAQRLEGYSDLVSHQQDLEDLKDDPPELRANYRADFARDLRKRGPAYRDHAKKQYEVALGLDDKSFEAHFGLAELFLESGYPGKAITHFTRATEIQSNKKSKTSFAHYNLAFLHRTVPAEEGGDPSKALQNAQLAVDYAPGDALDMRRLLAELLMQEGQKEKALEIANDIVGRDGATEGDNARVTRFTEGHSQKDMEKKPDDMEKKPDDMEKKPDDMEKKPDDMEKKPDDSMEKKPDDMEKKPDDMEKKPDDAEKKPDDMEKKPDDAEKKPDDMEKKPDDMEKKPDDAEKKPDDASSKPADN